MAWTPNPTPGYSVGPFAPAPILLPTTAKSVMTDNSNAVKVIDHTASAIANLRILLSAVDLLPAGALSAGKFWLFLAASGASTGFLEKDELVIASQSGFSSTVGGSRLNFPTWTSAKPLIVPEGFDLWAASSVAQGTPPFIDLVGKLF